MATYNKNEMRHQLKEALTRWSQYLENLLHDNVVPLQLKQVQYGNDNANPTTRSKKPWA